MIKNKLLVFLVLLFMVWPKFVCAAELTEADFRKLFSGFEELKDILKTHHTEENTIGDDARPIEELLNEIRESPYDFGHDRSGVILIKRGTEALPYLLKELPNSSSYYRLCLINILSQISSSERDSAFVKELEKLLNEKIDFLSDDIAKPLMRTVAQNNVSQAIPILKQFLKKSSIEKVVRSEARIALGLMGQPELCQVTKSQVKIDPSVNAKKFNLNLDLVKLLLGYELIDTPVEIKNILKEESVVKLKGVFKKGSWYIKFGESQDGKVPIYYSWYSGPLASAGYIGVFEKIGNGWVLSNWAMVWIS